MQSKEQVLKTLLASSPLIDTAAGYAAMRHCQGPVVTAAIDDRRWAEWRLWVGQALAELACRDVEVPPWLIEKRDQALAPSARGRTIPRRITSPMMPTSTAQANPMEASRRPSERQPARRRRTPMEASRRPSGQEGARCPRGPECARGARSQEHDALVHVRVVVGVYRHAGARVALGEPPHLRLAGAAEVEQARDLAGRAVRQS